MIKMKKREMKNKRALSPVITTILLILLAIVLASIILLWSKGLIKEHITKFDASTSEEKPIDEMCSLVEFSAVASGKSILITNTGNINIYKIGIKVSSSGGSSEIDEKEVNLAPTFSKTIESSSELSGGEVQLIPILLGKKEKSGEITSYTCKTNWQSLSS
jgi:flagellin-like protein